MKAANQCICHANLIGCQGFEVIRTHWIRDVMFSVIKVFSYKMSDVVIRAEENRSMNSGYIEHISEEMVPNYFCILSRLCT